MKKVALVTGASSGIGQAAAELFAKQGFTVYAAARSMDKLQAMASESIIPIALDVTNDASMQTCVKTILDAENRIDVLVNNAGYGSYGAVENVPVDEARRQLDVNLFGLARMCQLVLPAMRNHHSGRIINITSIGGRIWTPFGAWYHASKFAVEGLSASMRLELQPFGINVVVVEPGVIDTPWSDIAARHLRETSQDSVYAKSAARASDKLAKNYASRFATKPQTIGKCIVKAATAKRPRTRYMLGYGAKPLVYIQKLLGDRVYDALIRAML